MCRYPKKYFSIHRVAKLNTLKQYFLLNLTDIDIISEMFYNASNLTTLLVERVNYPIRHFYNFITGVQDKGKSIREIEILH